MLSRKRNIGISIKYEPFSLLSPSTLQFLQTKEPGVVYTALALDGALGGIHLMLMQLREWHSSVPGTTRICSGPFACTCELGERCILCVLGLPSDSYRARAARVTFLGVPMAGKGK